MTLEKDLQHPVKRRAGYKSRITVELKQLEDVPLDDLTSEAFLRRQESISSYLNRIEDINVEILDIYITYDVKDDDVGKVSEITNQGNYAIEIRDRLAVIAKQLKDKESPPPPVSVSSSKDNVKLPRLECDKFDGESQDKMAFKNFLQQFHNCINVSGQLSDSSKLTYLRGYLKGYAFRVISHLSVSDDNYAVALKLLKEEFLDEEYIIDETFKLLLNKSPKFDHSFSDVRCYINDCRSMLHELKLYGVDLLGGGSSGCRLMSHIIFSKLPPSVKRELVHKVNTNYPTVDQLFDHYNEILKTLIRTSSVKKEYPDKQISNNANVTGSKPKKEYKPFKKQEKRIETGQKSQNSKPVSTLENFSTSSVPEKEDSLKPRYCKFCESQGHNMYNCTTFASPEARVNRCDTLKICRLCSSNKHLDPQCPGLLKKMKFPCSFCKERTHISALCPSRSETSTNICINVQHTLKSFQPLLLPVLTFTFFGNEKNRSVRCLLDTGSQRSYLREDIVLDLRGEAGMSPVTYDITTFLGSSTRQLKEVRLVVGIPGRSKLPISFLADPQFNHHFRVSQLKTVWDNLHSIGVTLAEPNLTEAGDQFDVHGIIGVDVLQFLPKFELVPCMNGSAWKVPGGLVPFGNILHFLHPRQVIPIEKYECTENNFNNVVEGLEGEVPATMVNFVLHPNKSYFSPLESLFPDSAVEHGLEQMFSLDSVGCIDEANQLAQSDIELINEFKKGIQFKDNKYYVNLPWKRDLIEQVPSNHKVALSVLNRVTETLEKKGQLEDYLKVFHSQCEEGIIEKIEVEPKDFKNYVWIPHRPVFKVDPNTTTKIRPVFNCSLKTDNKPSLNEAAYAGVNLMGDIVQLSLYFRTNDIIMIGDIKQAFLQIRLAKTEDKNRFCFFVKEGEHLIAYRYKTLIFGFNASPFILNYVIRHHAGTYRDDEISQILRSNFYVDNLLFTHNTKEVLLKVYQECLSRMKQGGFYLRSWNSNSRELQSIMKKDGNLATHENEYEKVLGYKYILDKDVLQISQCNLDPTVNTKRGILSQVSKVFDPLGLILPVTIKGKLIVRDLWLQKLGWDDPVPGTTLVQWEKHCADLNQLFTLDIQRSCLNQDSVNSLCIFCDASKSCYGFTVYGIFDGRVHLLYAKSKVAPSKAKTLPTLELLAVYLALKCLPFILGAFKFINFDKIICAVDSQIVLQWLFTGAVSNKNVFTRNRLKDIAMFRDNLKREFRFDIGFKYVMSEDNPCDLLTRGLSFAEFEQKRDFWFHGPSWLASSLDSWPEHKLGCISEDNKLQLQPFKVTTSTNATFLEQSSSLIDVSRFSNFSKLLKIASLVFKAVHKFKGVSGEDPFLSGKLHLIKEMQKEGFSQEISYLNNPSGAESVPVLVKNLDLFRDEKGIIRSRGRIGKARMFDFEVINPILLAKNHPLTRLIVEFYHKRCKHLGIQTTMNTVRSNGFWIPKMRQCIKTVISSCITCKKFNSLSFRYPKMTNLPKHRVNFIKPFMHTGVDFTGHLFVKNESDENIKMYILIFTCLNVRAVHIELVPDMSTQSFVLAFLRFVNLYGVPSFLYSDNARSFISGGLTLDQALVCDEYKAQFQNYDIKHIRIPLYSAWVGATWERLIRTIKSCLYKTIGRARLTYFELLTVISDVQSAINSRPLTYRSTECDLEAITPSSFLKFHVNPHLLFKGSEEGYLWDRDPPSQESLSEVLASRDEAFQNFREKWYTTYLLSLREHSRDLHQCNWVNKVKAGDVVLIKTPNKTRPYWLMGRVLELIVGHDNAVRSVKLKRSDGQVVYHSINHLYPLELSITHAYRDKEKGQDEIENEEPPPFDENDCVDLESNSAGESVEETPSVRPKRHAAAVCKQNMRKWCAQLKQ